MSTIPLRVRLLPGVLPTLARCSLGSALGSKFQKPLFFVFSTPPPRAGLACGLRPVAAFRCSLLQPGIPTLRDRILFFCDEQRARLPEGLGPRRSRNVVLWSVGMLCPGARKVYGRTGILGPWPGESRSRGKTERFRLVSGGGGGVCRNLAGLIPQTCSVAPPFLQGFRVFVLDGAEPSSRPASLLRRRGQPWWSPTTVRWGRLCLHPWPHGTRVDDRSDRRL